MDSVAYRQLLWTTNQGLVIHFAKRYCSITSHFVLSDIVNFGNEGLSKAINRYRLDNSKNANFSTYASWWIRQSISRSVADLGRDVHIPSGVNERYSKVRKESDRLKQVLERDPTNEEVAETTEMDLDEVAELRLWGAYDYISLDDKKHSGDDNDSEIGDYFADNSDIEIQKTDDLSDQRELLNRIIMSSGLDNLAKMVIGLLYDIESYDDGDVVVTTDDGLEISYVQAYSEIARDGDLFYEDIARLLKIDIWQVFEIERLAMKKLRDSVGSEYCD